MTGHLNKIVSKDTKALNKALEELNSCIELWNALFDHESHDLVNPSGTNEDIYYKLIRVVAPGAMSDLERRLLYLTLRHRAASDEPFLCREELRCMLFNKYS